MIFLSVHDVVVISNFARVCHLFLFLFLSRRKWRQVETCFAPYPFTWHRWSFSARPFLLFFMYPYPLIVRPREFGLVFASLALVALEAGQSRRSYFLWFFSWLLPRAEFCTVCDPVCFSNLKPSSVLFVWLIVFIFNTIQCGVCHRVAKKIVCESFLGNTIGRWQMNDYKNRSCHCKRE